MRPVHLPKPSDFQLAYQVWLNRSGWLHQQEPGGGVLKTLLPGDVVQSDDVALAQEVVDSAIEESTGGVAAPLRGLCLHAGGAATFPVTRGWTAKKGANGLRTMWTREG